MDQKQIIHIASEVVVISGLAIYFKLKTSSLSTQVDELKKRIITQEQLIEEFKNRLDEHSLLISKQDQLITSLMIKQSLQPQMQAQLHSKQKSRPVSKQKVGIVWDSETDSSYFPEEKQILKTAKKIEQPIERIRVQQVEQPIERKRVQQVEQPIEQNTDRQVEQPIERKRFREVEQPIERIRVNHSEREEDLDEELQNELLELQESKSQTESESEIIEIDTSLKKKA